MPASRASSTAYWISGRSTIVTISLAMLLVAGSKRVPRPATGKTALRTRLVISASVSRRDAGVVNYRFRARPRGRRGRQASGRGRQIERVGLAGLGAGDKVVDPH